MENMGEEFYCILKLVSGEEILSSIMIDSSDEEEPIIILNNPILVTIMSGNMGTFMKIRPWMELTKEDIFFIKQDKILTMTETEDKNLINMYKNYVSDNDDEKNQFIDNEGKVKITDEMGYISSVEEARNLLEKIYKNLKEL